jgi:glycerol kinase
MVANSWFLQFLADILGIAVERPANVESTVLGAAYLAGLKSGVIASIEQISGLWQRDELYEPDMTSERREQLLAGWAAAVARVRAGD